MPGGGGGGCGDGCGDGDGGRADWVRRGGLPAPACDAEKRIPSMADSRISDPSARVRRRTRQALARPT